MSVRLLRALVVLVPVALTGGCDTDPAFLATGDDGPASVAPTGAFDPARCGRIEGRVTWPGGLPASKDFIYGIPKSDGQFETRMMTNPNRPGIEPASRAVAGAVVFLRGVNAAAAKPWDLPPARVEMRDRQIVVRQGDGPPRRCGFVRRGDHIELVAAEPVYHIIRGRGAAFFSLTFPDPDRPRSRTLDRAGRVELSSGSGFYWASADLFVDDHPYYTHTGPDGRFVLDQVPAGPVEVVAWLPGWDVGRQERDPESGLVLRQTYTPPVEHVATVKVTPAAVAAVELAVPVSH